MFSLSLFLLINIFSSFLWLYTQRVFNIVLYHRDKRLHTNIYHRIYIMLFVHYAFIVANEMFYNIENIVSLCHRAEQRGTKCVLSAQCSHGIYTQCVFGAQCTSHDIKPNDTYKTKRTNDRPNPTRNVCAQLTTHIYSSMPQWNELNTEKVRK